MELFVWISATLEDPANSVTENLPEMVPAAELNEYTGVADKSIVL